MTLRTVRESPIFVPGRRECPSCPTTEALCRELAELHPLLDLEVEEADGDQDPAPALTLEGAAAAGRVRFLGLPEGHEFASLLDAIRRVSGEPLALGEDTLSALAALRRPAHIRVFTTPT